MNNTEKLRETYKQFCLAEGNQHIASEFAVLKLQELMESFNIKSILEVGLGIGAIAGSILAINKDLTYTGTENNKFCLEALTKNLGKEHKHLHLISGVNELSLEASYELIIVDKDALNFYQQLESINNYLLL